MATKTYPSEEVGRKLQTILSDATTGRAQSIIEEQGVPTAVVISYVQWQAWQRQLSEEVAQIRKEMDAGEYVTQEELEVGLRERGLL